MGHVSRRWSCVSGLNICLDFHLFLISSVSLRCWVTAFVVVVTWSITFPRLATCPNYYFFSNLFFHSFPNIIYKYQKCIGWMGAPGVLFPCFFTWIIFRFPSYIVFLSFFSYTFTFLCWVDGRYDYAFFYIYFLHSLIHLQREVVTVVDMAATTFRVGVAGGGSTPRWPDAA